jgi:hypothetical protein
MHGMISIKFSCIHIRDRINIRAVTSNTRQGTELELIKTDGGDELRITAIKQNKLWCSSLTDVIRQRLLLETKKANNWTLMSVLFGELSG